MGKTTKLIIAAVGLGGLGFFLYKKGLFSSASSKITTVTPVVKVTPVVTVDTVKNPPTCESGFKLQMVDINCNGQDCKVHCVAIPAVPEWKEKPVPQEPIFVKIPPDPIFVPPVYVKPIFAEVPANPVIFIPYTDIPVKIVVDPTVGVVQNPILPVTDNTFKPVEVIVVNDPFEQSRLNKSVVNKELNQILYR